MDMKGPLVPPHTHRHSPLTLLAIFSVFVFPHQHTDVYPESSLSQHTQLCSDLSTTQPNLCQAQDTPNLWVS